MLNPQEGGRLDAKRHYVILAEGGRLDAKRHYVILAKALDGIGPCLSTALHRHDQLAKYHPVPWLR